MIGSINIKGEIGKALHLVDVISQVENQKEATAFDVYINSVGGSVDVGFDIYNYLKSLNVPIKTIGQEMVASIATVIFLAGDTREMEIGTEFMIHMPWGSVSGTSQEIEQYNVMLKKYEKKLIDFYTEKTGLNEDAIRPLLNYETWLSPKLAKDLNFTTSIANDVQVLAKANFNFKPINKMNEEQKGMFTKLFEKVDAIFAKVDLKIKNIILQDANGVEIDFVDVAEGENPIVGKSIANVDGKPAEGEYLMPDGQTYVFVGGVLTEIKEAPEDEQAKKIAELEQQLADAKAEITAKETALNEVSTVVAKLRSEVKSSFKPKAVEKKEDEEVTGSAYRELVLKAKNKKR